MTSIGINQSSLSESDNNKNFGFIDSEGCILCPDCHEGTPCKCDEERRKRFWEDERQRENQVLVERLRRDGIPDPMYARLRFEVDDRKNPDISDLCRDYVDKWEQMLAGNKGLMLYGTYGTGKTFQACSIANALIDKQIPVLVTNFTRILNKIQSVKWGEDKNELFEQLQRYALVVIDDFGVERSTDFVMEQLYQVINMRYLSDKPLIITTNLSLSEFKNPADPAHARIYDRIRQMCVPIPMKGESRRVEISKLNGEEFESLLGL